MAQAPILVRPATRDDRPQIEALLRERWGSDIIVAHEQVYHLPQLPALVARQSGEMVGTLTYHRQGDACEIVTIDSLVPGAGTALLSAIIEIARRDGCHRLWLITTNDNVDALAFYQKRGFVLCALRPNAIAASRRLKPQIPEVAANGIPIRDELELEMAL